MQGRGREGQGFLQWAEGRVSTGHGGPVWPWWVTVGWPDLLEW